ncbi:MAG: hypothetical protein U1G07_27395 [Verrucomicrobiota bacterium]
MGRSTPGLRGTVGAELTSALATTRSIQKFISSADKNVADIFDGFYIIDFDESGNERPEVRFLGEIFAGAEINLGVAEAGVEGGVRVTVDFDLNDFNNDGRIRSASCSRWLRSIRFACLISMARWTSSCAHS